MKAAPITYLREGRKLRATGTVVEVHLGHTKVKPIREDWGHVWLSAAEIEAGGEKGPPIARKQPAKDAEPKKREKCPKPAPVPRWKQLVDRVRIYEVDHHPTGWPGVQMKFVSELADELEKAQTMFSKP